MLKHTHTRTPIHTHFYTSQIQTGPESTFFDWRTERPTTVPVLFPHMIRDMKHSNVQSTPTSSQCAHTHLWNSMSFGLQVLTVALKGVWLIFEDYRQKKSADNKNLNNLSTHFCSVTFKNKRKQRLLSPVLLTYLVTMKKKIICMLASVQLLLIKCLQLEGQSDYS